MESFGVKTSNQRERPGVKTAENILLAVNFARLFTGQRLTRLVCFVGLDKRDSSSQTVSTDVAPACVHAVGVATMPMPRWKRKRPKLF